LQTLSAACHSWQSSSLKNSNTIFSHLQADILPFATLKTSIRQERKFSERLARLVGVKVKE
jgi:hypothetical protein